MPYVNDKTREYYEKAVVELGSTLTNRYNHRLAYSGDLNYIITRLLLATKPELYDDYSTLIGVLESCKLEFYRRAVASYEDQKITGNGDVYL